MSVISETTLPAGISYVDYQQLVETLFAAGKATGDNHSEAILHYTKLNMARMRRLDKTSKILPEVATVVQAVERPLRWLTLTEGWCGDAAQVIPIIDKLASLNAGITHEIILRDEHLDVMDQFLTNGARSIPITIILDAATNKVLGHWGPRPMDAQNMVLKAKAAAQAATDDASRKAIMDDVKLEAQKWYTRDKGRAVQTEFLTALEAAIEN